MAGDVEIVQDARCFGGRQKVCAHDSRATGTRMEFALYLPPQAENEPCPVLYWLSGLTCNWENFTVKAGAQRYAAEHGLILVAPDTSPRGEGVPDVPDYDFGQGAGFYVNAQTDPWARHFRMYDYVVEELPEMVQSLAPVTTGRGLCGHSMGGHGALTIGLRHPEHYQTLSAFAPIVAPASVPWGRRAFAGYLGPDENIWAEHDACALAVERGWPGDILVDQGLADGFLAEQLRPELFAAACDKAGIRLILNRRAGYDHSYYFVASFIADHIAHHARHLRG